MINNRNRKDKIRANTINGGVSLTDWKNLLADFEYECAYCGEQKALTMDHIIPLSKGGLHCIENVTPACKNCNLSKGVKSVEEWSERKEATNPT